MEFKPESTSNQQELTQKKVSNTFLTNDENKENTISEIPSLNKKYQLKNNIKIYLISKKKKKMKKIKKNQMKKI